MLVMVLIFKNSCSNTAIDSLHLGNMNRHRPPLRDIVTHDGDFGHVPGLIVWEPMDVVS